MFHIGKQYNSLISILLVLLIISLPIRGEIVSASDNRFEAANIERSELEEYIKDIIDWKKAQQQQPQEILFTNSFLEDAGEASTDWYVIGLGRAGIEDDYAAYLAMIQDAIEKQYQQEEKLSNAKATEWHRISLAILAAGGDPTNVGKDESSKVIDLIADGTYNRGKDSRPLGTQGINGWIWGLITLDSLRYNVPDGAVETRESIIKEILQAQLKDGGFALNTYETESDIDITAMAIQALAPYYNSEETYTYKENATGEKVTKKVRDVVDEAVQLLSEMQLVNGDYEMTGISNVESTAQVMLALTTIGIDPLQDERFIKNSNTLLDAILTYQMPDGGFLHSESYDEENEYADPNESNSMASEQVLYTLTALYRFYDDRRSLYDFREEMSAEVKEKITFATEKIDQLPKSLNTSHTNQVQEAFDAYLEVPIEERSYVFNYVMLADAMKQLNIENTSEFLAEYMGQNGNGKGHQFALFDQTETQAKVEAFTKDDEERVEILLEEAISTESYVDVVTLLDKLNHPDTKEEHKDVLGELEHLKASIEAQATEIEELNKIILDELYPFNNISTKDQSVVEDVMNRYQALTPYDQTKVQGYDDVEKAATQINNMVRARYITIGIGIIIVGMSILLVIRYKRRKKAKLQQQMRDIIE